MITFSPDSIPSWIKERVLQLVNTIDSPRDLLRAMPNMREVSSDARATEYFIGNKVAERIIAMRQDLPGKRYTQLHQLRNVRGLGEDKFQSILNLFNVPSADEFREELYNKGVLNEANWTLSNYTIFFPEPEDYEAVVSHECHFREFIVDEVKKICLDHEADPIKSRLVGRSLSTAHMDYYSNSTSEAGLAFALWFYRFDADNWFTFERMREHTQAYFNTYAQSPHWEMDLYFFKPFYHEVLSDGLVPPSLPVVTCDAESSITIWTSALYD